MQKSIILEKPHLYQTIHLAIKAMIVIKNFYWLGEFNMMELAFILA
jgi:hypothetical protein